MSKFSLPIPISRLHPCLTGSDSLFLKERQAEGYNHLSCFLLLLESKGIAYPSEYSIIPVSTSG